jgi:Tfp pilus assembly protein PilV
MNKGQRLFEVVVALAISALVVVALVSLVSNSIRNATFSKNKSLASTYAQETIEWLRSERDNDVSTFMTNALTPSWCFPSLNWSSPGSCSTDKKIQNTEFLRKGSFTVSTENNIETGQVKNIVNVTIDVSWSDSQGLHQISNTTNFSDWRER